jgi:hypothetical protein
MSVSACSKGCGRAHLQDYLDTLHGRRSHRVLIGLINADCSFGEEEVNETF